MTSNNRPEADCRDRAFVSALQDSGTLKTFEKTAVNLRLLRTSFAVASARLANRSIRTDYNMHTELVRFDRLFDVVKRSGAFSFETGGKRIYGVRLPQRMIPNEGETYLIAFEKPGDFTTVLGWSKPGSREMVIEDTRAALNVSASFELLFMIVTAIACTGLSMLGKAGLVTAACVLPVVMAVRLWQRHSGITQSLDGVPPASV